jgi:hypothetical protein
MEQTQTENIMTVEDLSNIISDVNSKITKSSRESFKKYYNSDHGRAKTLIRYYMKSNKDPIISKLLELEIDPVEKYNLIMVHRHFRKTQ